MLLSYDAAQQFMVKVLPWPAEGEEGYCNLHWSQMGDNGKLFWQGRAYKSPADAINFIQWVSGQKGGKNFYVCMSSQKNAEKKQSQSGHEYLKAIRLHTNILAFKAIWMDLDFKNYPSEAETIQAFSNFITTTKLPAPSVYVNTGGGIHVYWTFSQAIKYEAWQPVAFALAEACKRHGLNADVACTVDSVRLLRVPDTFNYKYTPPRRVRFLIPPKDFDYLFEKVSAPLEPYRVAIAQQPGKVVENDLSAGIGAFAPVDIKNVIPNCPFLQENLRTHGAGYGQPLWALTGLLCTFTIQGKPLFHVLSNGHSEYTRESSDDLYDRKERERKSKNIGWPTCSSIETAGSKACQGCPHRGEHKSPLHFTKPPKVNGHASASNFVASESNIQYLPPNYRHTEAMKVVLAAYDEEGVEISVPITSWPAYDAWLEQASDGGLKLYFTTELNRQPKIIAVPTSIIPSVGKLSECLSGQGCEIPKGQQKAVGDFTVAWMSKLKESNAFKSTSSFGWNIHNGQIIGFNYGGQLWKPDGHIPAATVNISNSEHYTPVGELSVWREASKLIASQERNELNAILASAFAAPLVQFTGQSAFLVSAWSPESGTQKTSAMKTAQAVWGHPVKAMQSLEDTNNAVLNKLGLTNSLPLFWDEMGATVASKYRDTINLLMQLTSGREKARLDHNSQQREVKVWNNILTCASNNSLKDFIASQSNISPAALNRIIEFVVLPGVRGQISDPKATRILSQLQFNYGQAGFKYAQFLGASFRQVEVSMQELLESIHEEVGSEPSERFWLANMCCMMLGVRYAKQLDLVDVDEPALKGFLIDNFISMRGDRKDQIVDFKDASVVAQAITQFIDEIGNDHILRTDRIPDRGRSENVTPTAAPPRSTPYVQITTGTIRVSYDQFARWLQRSKFADNYVSILKAISAHEGVTRKKASIGAGLNLPGGATQKLVLDLDTSKIPDLIIEQIGAVEAAASNVVLFAPR